MKKTKQKRLNKVMVSNDNKKGFSIHLLILFIFSFLLYANTLKHDYTQDDAIVIYDNMFTTKGISGISGLLKYDTFYGFFKEKGKAKLVSGGRYRPLTPVMFAIERQIFGDKPFWGHLFNVLWFSFLIIVLYKVLERLLLYDRENPILRNVILLACLLYAAHPIHTEAVANIKGRDEIIALLGSLAGFYFILKAYDTGSKKYLVFAGISGFLAFLSKENAITFLAVIPLGLVFFRDLKWGKAIAKTTPYLLAAVLFLILRTAVLGLDFGDKPMELMNNPFLKISGNKYVAFSPIEWISTIIFIMLKYLQLLIFPHPLTHDYYPRHIDIMSLGDWQVWLGILAYIGLIYVMIKKWKTDKIVSWSIFFFIATISIVSNIVFPIGTNMSERFLFMPSVGFVLVLAYFIMKLPQKFAFGVSIVVLLLFSVKTFTRNRVWKNDFTLFTTDVKTSINSAKVLNAAGGALSTEGSKEKNEVKKKKMLNESIGYLGRAIEIHPNYKNAYLIRGNDYFYLGKLDKAIEEYKRALSLSPEFKDAKKNLAIAYRDRGRLYGEKENNLAKAIEYLNNSLSIKGDDIEALRLLAISYGMGGNHAKAIENFKKITILAPNNASAFANLSSAYRQSGDIAEAEKNTKKALELDPKVFEKMRKKD